MSDFSTSTTIIKSISYRRPVFINGSEYGGREVEISVGLSLDDFLNSGTDDAVDFAHFWNKKPKPEFAWAEGTTICKPFAKFGTSYEEICVFNTCEPAPPVVKLYETYSQYMRRTANQVK